MITQKRTIHTEIEKNGWKIVEVDRYEWWENEVWKVESVWSPIGKQAFIVFLVDPMNHNDKSDVWAVSASIERPTTRFGKSDDFLLVLNTKWEKELPEFIKYLSEIRNQ